MNEKERKRLLGHHEKRLQWANVEEEIDKRQVEKRTVKVFEFNLRCLRSL
jgi:hypothetical protein